MSDYRDELNKLFTAGEPSRTYDAKANHLLNFHLTRDDIPALIQIVLENSNEEFEEPKSWAAVHAWRALGQLKAKEAIPALIEVLERDVWEEWGWEELPEILAQFGTDALPLVYQLMLKHRANFEIGIMVVAALELIAKGDEMLLEPIKTMMIEVLNEAQKNEAGVNGYLISALTDFQATEALPVIEKAFEGDNVDIFVAGDWDHVQVAFGLKDASEVEPLPPLWDFVERGIDFLPFSEKSEKEIQKKKSKRQMAKKSKQINRQKKKKK